MFSEFRERVRITPKEPEEKKMLELEAYKNFVAEAMPGYIGFMEALNHTITELQLDGFIGKTKLRTRLKSVKSALINTRKKSLDDIFGFEIVAQNEEDKELLMLIIHNLFNDEFARDKNINKSNGYFAHHCTGAVKMALTGTEASRLENHILNTQTSELKPEYRDLSHEERRRVRQTGIETYIKKPRYPILRERILKNGEIDKKLQEEFDWALGFIDQYLSGDMILRRGMPVFEIHFLTAGVEQEATRGRAAHVKYKHVNEEEIKGNYLKRSLARGVDFPFVFIRNGEGDLQIEHTSDTLISMWPFLEETIQQYKDAHSYPVANYDLFFSRVFPGLEPYVQRNLVNEPSLVAYNYNSEMAWGFLKNKIINESFVLPDSEGINKIREGD